MECPICGYPMGENDAFCTHCGNFALPLQDSSRSAPSSVPGAVPDDATVVFHPVEDGNSVQTVQKAAQRLYPYQDEEPPIEEPAVGESQEPPMEPAYEPEPKPGPPVWTLPVRSARKGKGRKELDRWLLVAIAACCVAVISIISAIYVIHNTSSLRVQLNMAQKESSTARANAAELEDEVTELNRTLDTYKAENQALGAQVAELQGQINGLETNVNQSTYDKEAALDLLAVAQKDLAAAQEELEAAQTELESTQEALTEANDKNASLTEENSSLSSTVKDYESTLGFFNSHVVFVNVNSSNKYYHTYGCENFSKNDFLAYNVKLAKSHGYTPCPVCLGGTNLTGDGEADVDIGENGDGDTGIGGLFGGLNLFG